MIGRLRSRRDASGCPVRCGLESAARDAADLVDFGRPSARKRGRNPSCPYVPVLERDGYTTNPARGRAYATRQEAVDAAQRQADAARSALARRLLEPRHRALRAHHGLPLEIPT